MAVNKMPGFHLTPSVPEKENVIFLQRIFSLYQCETFFKVFTTTLPYYLYQILCLAKLAVSIFY